MKLLPRSRGQTILEYGLIILLVGVATVVVLVLVGPAIGDAFSIMLSAV